ncbi:peptide arginase family protein [Acetobacterium woodii]|uniref:Uncharacterized protein n=1 Tax=Acetobacterium woodii (strain ATCC 29683 / DSM 1030 / JCM 2381 / KCTC 1655 / WB1) TaxID=931626 RepID=H6LEY6_ACEWD|nr:UPF0489 family protein [Acetobacterium woodii]AFA46892.1 hypothetical protein Awo_c00780 [Acetobacterium woodii DSM 1030]
MNGDMSDNNLRPSRLNINGKAVWVVDDHQYALLIWTKLFLDRQASPVLLSIDYHPDTNPPFWLYAYQKAMAIDPEREVELVEKFQKKMMTGINLNDLDTLQAVMASMRNDEQINTALELGIISDYHMVNCMEKHDYLRGHHYLVPENQFGCLDDVMFENIGLPLAEISSHDLILDIDLDYFRSRDNFNLELKQNKIFSDLVKQAKIITIARSKSYFDFLKKETFTIEECQERLIRLLTEIC